MTLWARRRGLMGKDSRDNYGTPFLSPFGEWHKSSGITILSDDSAKIKTSGNNYYMYSAGTDGKLYSELNGKIIVIDFDMSADSIAYIQLGLKTHNNAGYGISAVTDKVTFSNLSGNAQHYHREISVGTDFVAPSGKTGNYLIVCIRTNNTGTISNFRCGYK